MHGAIIFKILLLVSVFALSAVGELFGQPKPSGEVEITRCWAYPTGELSRIGLAADTGHVFIGKAGAEVETLNLEGRKLWSTELGGEILSNLLPSENSLYLVTSARSADTDRSTSDSVLRSLSSETGVTNWTRSVSEADGHFLHNFNGWILVVSFSGSIAAVDARTGAVVWRREIAVGFAARPVFNRARLIVATTGNQVFSIAMSSGEIEAVRKLSHPVTALGEAETGEIIAGDDRGNITSLLNAGDKSNWRFKGGGEISSLVISGTNILAASHDNFVYLLIGRNGNVAWKRRLAGRAAFLVGVMDRYALMSSTEDQGAAIVDVANGKVAGRFTFADGETLVAEPVISEGRILTLTSQAVYSYSLSSCLPTKEGGTAKMP